MRNDMTIGDAMVDEVARKFLDYARKQQKGQDHMQEVAWHRYDLARMAVEHFKEWLGDVQAAIAAQKEIEANGTTSLADLKKELGVE